MAGEAIAAPAAAPQGAPAQTNQPGVPGQTAVKPPAPAPEPPKYYERKVNGQVRRYTVDEMLDKMPLVDGSMERFEQAAEAQRRHGAWKQNVQRDFMQALMDPELGLTKEQIKGRFEHWYKENFIDPATMSPEAREAMEAKQRAKQLQDELDQRKAQEQQMRDFAAKQQLSQQMQGDIMKALDGAPDLPKTRFTVSRMAYWQKQNLRRGFDAPMSHIIQQVRDEYRGVNRSGMETMKDQPEKIAEWIVGTYGKDVIKAIRKLDQAQIQALFAKRQQGGGIVPAPQQAPPSQQDAAPQRRKGPNSVPMRDVDNYLNELRRQKR